uniref:Carbonic anhydrase Va n=1 Tax=Nothobranchius furzeri TaxID=105023 RepID=A0A8C6LYZ2_NOTFU
MFLLLWRGAGGGPGHSESDFLYRDRQSPVDIAVKKSVFDAELKPLVTSYDPHTCQQIWNNGYSFLVEYDDTKDKNTLTGGPLQDQFRLCQFHFHWGETNEWGSEHTVDRRLFPAEVLPHYHLIMKFNPDYCLIPVQVGKRHEGLQKLVDALPTIRHKDSIVEFNRFDPSCLLPGNINDYWTYHGSLTTPPLTESVTWIIMKQHIEVSHDQVFEKTILIKMLFNGKGEPPPPTPNRVVIMKSKTVTKIRGLNKSEITRQHC